MHGRELLRTRLCQASKRVCLFVAEEEGLVSTGDHEEDDSSSNEDSLPPLMAHETADHPHDDNDDMPSLVTSDDSDDDSLLDLDHTTANSLPDLESDHDSESEGSDLSDEEDGVDDDDHIDTGGFLASADFPPARLPLASADLGSQMIGPNTPLALDQQAAVDDLSHELDVADALAASVRLVRLNCNLQQR